MVDRRVEDNVRPGDLVWWLAHGITPIADLVVKYGRYFIRADFDLTQVMINRIQNRRTQQDNDPLQLYNGLLQ